MGTANPPAVLIQQGLVSANLLLCRDHYRLTFCVDRLAEASPGQFVHLGPELGESASYRIVNDSQASHHEQWRTETAAPLIRRAFSIAGLRRSDDYVELDVIYHVVGTATKWMQSLTRGDTLSALGPLGNEFPISTHKRKAWLVAGGVGLPPMLWLAQSLGASQRQAIAFCGVRSRDLLPLSLSDDHPASEHADVARGTAVEFAESGVPVVISSDDGSIGFRGHVGAALAAYHRGHSVDPDDLVVYTCGPERMMQFVVEFCGGHGIECYCCMERSMACGTGTCQSCVLPVRDLQDPDGWSYRLCCTDGPVFPADRLVWTMEHTPAAPYVGAQ